MKRINKKGFTLVELLAAITILGIITALSIPLIRGIQESNEKRKFTTYSDSLEKSAKLYVDSYSEDLFGHRDGGCAYITWQQLYEKNLTKDIQMADISCNSKNSFIKVVKYKNHYNYYPSLGCGTKKDGKVSEVTVTLPEEEALEINEEGCGGPDGSSMTIGATPSFYTKNDRQKVRINIRITSPTGITPQKSISYAWSTTNNYNDSLDWKHLDITIPNRADQEAKINSGNQVTVTSKPLLTPANQTGEYYLVIKVDTLSDLLGTTWNAGDAEKKNHVIFGKYIIDNAKPVIQKLIASSSKTEFNSVTPKITLDATDDLAPTGKLKMCYSYDEDSCGKTKEDFKSSDEYTEYATSKTLPKIKDKIDGTSHKIYVTVVDPAGNYTTKTVDYKISLKHNITYNLNGGTNGLYAPTTAYADREITISNPSKKITVSFNANGKGATISSTANITRNYTFMGWRGENLSPTALTGYNSATTQWSGSQTKNKRFKRLTDQYNATVKMTANWASPNITLPRITKTGYTCTWNSSNTCNGSLSLPSGATYTPTSETTTKFYACCNGRYLYTCRKAGYTNIRTKLINNNRIVNSLPSGSTIEVVEDLGDYQYVKVVSGTCHDCSPYYTDWPYGYIMSECLSDDSEEDCSSRCAGYA